MIRPLRHSNGAKQKKLFAFIVLFFVLSGFILPNIALAFSISPNTFQCTNGILSSISIQCFNYYIAYTISSLGDLSTWIGSTFLEVSSNIFLFTLSNLIKNSTGKWAITKDTSYAGTAFLAAWNAVKNWANMLIVLGFIAVAMAFILSLEQYKKLLVPLLIVALLVNFSILFVGLIIDASNILMISLTGSGQGISDIQYKINSAWDRSLYQYPIDSFTSSLIYVSLSLIFTSIYVITGLTLLLFAMIFVIRYVALALLFILSPLAFVFRVIPIESAKKMWNSWWQHFLKWCFMGISGAFFLSLATQILAALNDRLGPIIGNYPSNIAVEGAISEIFFYLAIVEIFLLAGLWLTFKSNPLITALLSAVAVIAGAILTGGASLAGGVLKIAGKVTGTSGRLTDTKNKVKDSFSNVYHGLREGIGLAGRGTAVTKKQERLQERLKEPTERLKNADDATVAKAVTKGTYAERAAATNILKERGKLHLIPEAQRQNAVANAMAHNSNLKASDFAKSHYEFAEHDDESLRKIEAEHGWTKGDSRAKTIARQRQLQLNAPSMSPLQLANIKKEDLTREFLTSRAVTPNMISNFNLADRETIKTLKSREVRKSLREQIAAAKKDKNKSEENRLKNIRNAIRRLPKKKESLKKQNDSFRKKKDNDLLAISRDFIDSTPKERASATIVLSERGRFNEIRENKAGLKEAMEYDNTLPQLDYRFADFNEPELRKIEDDKKWAKGDPRAQAIARQRQLRVNLPTMSSSERASIDKSDVTPGLVSSKSFTADMVQDFDIKDLKKKDVLAKLKDKYNAAEKEGNKVETERISKIEKRIFKERLKRVMLRKL